MSLLTASIAFSVLSQASTAPADDPAAVREAIARGVKSLLAAQDAEGAIRDARPAHRTALSSLAILAMAAVGHMPAESTAEGTAMKRALDFVLDTERQNGAGYFGEHDQSRMYGQGITTLMLAEMLGMGADEAQNRLIRDRCVKGVGLLLRSQAVAKDDRWKGGWRYLPEAEDADLSVTAWQVLALRAAKNAGLAVPKEAVDSAVGFVSGCFVKKGAGEGAYSYQPGRGVTASMASAGLLTIQLCGKYDAPEAQAVSDWLLDQRLDPRQEWFYYAVYYYSQAMRQRSGKYADHSRRHVAELLLPLQNADGSWKAQTKKEGAFRVYATAMAILALAVDRSYLPIYER